MIQKTKNQDKLVGELPIKPKQKSQYLGDCKYTPVILNQSLPQSHNELSLQQAQIPNFSYSKQPIFNLKNYNKSLPKSTHKQKVSIQSHSKKIRSPSKTAQNSKIKEQQTSIASFNQNTIKKKIQRFAPSEKEKPKSQEVQLVMRQEIEIFQCSICFQEHPIASKIRFDDTCPHIFCQVCIQEQVRFLIKSNRLIKCPQATCDKTIDEKSAIYSKMTKTQQKQYRKILKNLNRKADSRCPCCAKLIKIGRSQCGKCGVFICPICMQLKHEGDCNLNFEGISYRQIKASHNLLRCNRCRRYIQKNGGCSHITCICGHYFCQICGETLTVNHTCKDKKQLKRPRPLPKKQNPKKQTLIIQSNQAATHPQELEVNAGPQFIWNVITDRPSFSILLLFGLPCDLLCFLFLLVTYVLGFILVLIVAFYYDTLRTIFQTYDNTTECECIGWTLILITGFPIVIIIYWMSSIINRTQVSLLPQLNPYMQRIVRLPVTSFIFRQI